MEVRKQRILFTFFNPTGHACFRIWLSNYIHNIMKALLYIGASCFLLLALNGSAENTQIEEEYHDYGTDTCPFPVLGNKSLKT
ncbi:hypothetical protein V5799_031087, partial [Amblyomma americanum]